jgi:folate-binding protein YgfZ
MSNTWFNFLNRYGATFNTDNEITFSLSDNSHSTLANSLHGDLFLTDLSYLGVIEVTGDDKKTFLQGQLTNDVNAVSSSLAHLTGLCTPKGRLRALFLLFAQTDKLYLQLPQPLLEETLKRLKMFVMMSKVELTNISEQKIRIGISGQQAIKYLKEYGLTIPSQTNMVSDTDGIQLIRLAGETPRFECLGNNEAMQKLWQTLHPDAQLLNSHQWKLFDIQAGIPTIFSSSKEAFIPQMLNLQVLNGINFKKGCYTGQEIVARMQYLGKLKRKMYRASCQCNLTTLPIAGDVLYSESSKSAQGAGHIVDAQHSFNGGIELLAVITNEAIKNNDIYLDQEKKMPLVIEELPYTLEENTETS